MSSRLANVRPAIETFWDMGIKALPLTRRQMHNTQTYETCKELQARAVLFCKGWSDHKNMPHISTKELFAAQLLRNARHHIYIHTNPPDDAPVLKLLVKPGENDLQYVDRPRLHIAVNLAAERLPFLDQAKWIANEAFTLQAMYRHVEDYEAVEKRRESYPFTTDPFTLGAQMLNDLWHSNQLMRDYRTLHLAADRFGELLVPELSLREHFERKPNPSDWAAHANGKPFHRTRIHAAEHFRESEEFASFLQTLHQIAARLRKDSPER